MLLLNDVRLIGLPAYIIFENGGLIHDLINRLSLYLSTMSVFVFKACLR